MSKKHVIEIQAPEGKIPVYDESTGTIKFVDEDIKSRVKTVADALEILGITYPAWVYDAPYSQFAMYQLQIVLRVLNQDHDFSLTEGKVWFPRVRFYSESKLPSNEKKNIIGKFICEEKRYYLLGSYAHYGGSAGLGCFYSLNGVGSSHAGVGILSCKDKETALYVCKQFGQLVFDAIYADKINYSWLL